MDPPTDSSSSKSSVVYGLDVHVISLGSITTSGFLTLKFGNFAAAVVEFDGKTNREGLHVNGSDVGGVFSVLPIGYDLCVSELESLSNDVSVDVFEGSSGSFKLAFKDCIVNAGLVGEDLHGNIDFSQLYSFDLCVDIATYFMERRLRFHPFQLIAANAFRFRLHHAVGVGTDACRGLEITVGLYRLDLSNIHTIPTHRIHYQKIAITGRVVPACINIDQPVTEEPEPDAYSMISCTSATTEEFSNSSEFSFNDETTIGDVILPRVEEPLIKLQPEVPPIPRVSAPKLPVTVRTRAPPPEPAIKRIKPKASHYMMDTTASKARIYSDLGYLRSYRECDDIAVRGKKVGKNSSGVRAQRSNMRAPPTEKKVAYKPAPTPASVLPSSVVRNYNPIWAKSNVAVGGSQEFLDSQRISIDSLQHNASKQDAINPVCEVGLIGLPLAPRYSRVSPIRPQSVRSEHSAGVSADTNFDVDPVDRIKPLASSLEPDKDDSILTNDVASKITPALKFPLPDRFDHHRPPSQELCEQRFETESIESLLQAKQIPMLPQHHDNLLTTRNGFGGQPKFYLSMNESKKM